MAHLTVSTLYLIAAPKIPEPGLGTGEGANRPAMYLRSPVRHRRGGSVQGGIGHDLCNNWVQQLGRNHRQRWTTPENLNRS